MTEQAVKNELKARQILDLYEAKKVQVVDATHSQHSMAALDFLFDQPIFNSSDFIKGSGISAPSARRILRQLADCSMLRTMREAKGARSAVFAFAELLNIAEGRKVFDDHG